MCFSLRFDKWSDGTGDPGDVSSSYEDDDEGYLSPGEEGGSQFMPSPPRGTSFDFSLPPPRPSRPKSGQARSMELSKLSERCRASSLPSDMNVYPIFRKNLKTVYIIRHGEYNSNARKLAE
eukprot:9053088-Pyramimonas_sp.AAC.3